MRYTTIILLLSMIFLLFSSVSLAVEARSTDYCDDVQSWQEWEDLLQKNPDDDGIYSLYAFRVGLCVMVRKKQVELERAIQLFEEMRQAVIHYMEDGARQEKESEKEEGTI